jgi:DNA-directed RNA polymerase specialized sigma24 family protein
VTQEIFRKLWQALPDYDGRASLGTWLCAIARNTCLSAVRMNLAGRSASTVCLRSRDKRSRGTIFEEKRV